MPQSLGAGAAWCARLGSNQQPLPSEGSTLSIELRTHRLRMIARGRWNVHAPAKRGYNPAVGCALPIRRPSLPTFIPDPLFSTYPQRYREKPMNRITRLALPAALVITASLLVACSQKEEVSKEETAALIAPVAQVSLAGSAPAASGQQRQPARSMHSTSSRRSAPLAMQRVRQARRRSVTRQPGDHALRRARMFFTTAP